MPGKKEDARSYSFISPVKQLRVVADNDVDTQDGITAIPEFINGAVDDSGAAISVGRENELILGVLLDGVTSATVAVYVDLGTAIGHPAPWAFISTQTVTRSTHICMRHFYSGTLKVVVTGLVGAGGANSVTITYSKSA